MSAETALLITLCAYMLLMLGIGAWASKRSGSDSDFYLAGRGLGPWVAALSAAASSSSAWTLLGVSGAAFTYGLSAFWLLPACLSGFLLNWLVVARPLRRASVASGAVTVTEFLAEEAPPRLNRALVVSASLIVLLSLMVYVASQFQAAGKTFAETLEMDFRTAVLVGGAVVLLYTLSGGFWAASVTDMVQGLVMAAASLAVPAVALWQVGGLGAMADGLAALDPKYVDLWRGNGGWTAVAFVVGTFGIGLGYPGQPHVVNRFMALRSEEDIRRGTAISLGWALVIYGGMLLTGWCGRVILDAVGDDEAMLLRLTTELFPPVVAGVIVAAVLSAIMSTADSQLLVCGSTASYDLPAKRPEGDKRHVRLDRLAVLGLGGAAVAAAILLDSTIFDTVLFAWSGLGAAFGPLLLVRLSGRTVDPRWALAAMWSGFVLTLVWYNTPALKGIIYELVPSFTLSLAIAWTGSRRR